MIKPTNTQFYKIFVGDIINKLYVVRPDNLFLALNTNNPNIKCTIEDKFFDTKIIHNNGIFTTKFNWKERKLPVHWASRIPKRYKRYSIISDLNRALHVSSFVKDEILNADYPLRFINSVREWFNGKLSNIFN